MKRSYIKRLLENMSGKNQDNQPPDDVDDNSNHFSTDIRKNEKMLSEQLGTSQDVMLTKFKIKLHNSDDVDAMLVAIDGLVDEEVKRNNVIKPLIEPPLEKDPSKDLASIRERLAVKSAVIEGDPEKVLQKVLKAQAFLLIDGLSEGLLISIEGFEIRSIEEPETEQIVRGSREGFIESLSVNLSMVRRRIASPSLRFETMEIGEYSQTDVTIAYIKDIVDPKIVHEVKSRICQIKVDNINSSGDIEQLIEDHPYSIFPTIGNTERPDKVSRLLMHGRVVIFVDGDPICLYAPFLFVESMKNIEDYISRPYYTSFIRLIRFFSFALSITLPALYISAVNFNKALIPSSLIVPLTVARESVPFPLALEVMIMIIMFEVVREAGVRLPKQVGTAVTIVGPLILGDVAVSTSLVGAPTVIIVSISFIAAFVITPIADVTALLRIALFGATCLFGSYGLTMMLLAVFTHMVSLTSLGIPYMAPFSPFHFRDWKDALIRFPTKVIKRRSESIPNLRSKKIDSIPDSEDKQ